MTASLVPRGGYPPATRGRIVLWGLLASAPFGGMTWQVLHYLGGFRRLGYDVWYVEDADVLFDPTTLDYAYTPEANLRYLAEQMDAVGLADRWLFRIKHLDPRWYGNGDGTTVSQVQQSADAVYNLCGSRAAYSWVDDLPPNLFYLETDPGDMQAHVAHGDPDATTTLQRHRRRYTYGVNVGTPRFAIPTGDMTWLPTRPPVVLDWWDGGPPRDRTFTTVTQWNAGLKPSFEWDGLEIEWRKDVHFEAVIDLPARSPIPLELALRGASPQAQQHLAAHGWGLYPADRLDAPDTYRDYIRGSAGEFTISKDQYTKLNSAWFSDRTVCYLAAGRPVVTHATGFEEHLPVGEGLFAFTTADDAAAALEMIASDYPRHAAAAREIAREHFAHDRVLPSLLAEEPA